MRATGIVRRIDELGRVVIPKEIRRTQAIRVGDPLEIFVEAGGEVVLKKYSPVGELASSSQMLCDVLYKAMASPVAVTDRDRVVAAAGARELTGRGVGVRYEQVMNARRMYGAGEGQQPVPVAEGVQPQAAAVMPILANGDLVGSVALLGEKRPGECETLLLRVTAGYLGRRLEE